MLKDLRERIRTMDPIRKKYLTFTLSIFLVFSVLLTIVFTLQFDKINAIHAENTREQIVSIKMEFLEDSVNNTIGYIEEMKTIQEDRFKSRIQRLAVIVQDEHKSDRI